MEKVENNQKYSELFSELKSLNNLLNNVKHSRFRIIMMDINNLKYVNDTFGQLQILRETTEA